MSDGQQVFAIIVGYIWMAVVVGNIASATGKCDGQLNPPASLVGALWPMALIYAVVGGIGWVAVRLFDMSLAPGRWIARQRIKCECGKRLKGGEFCSTCGRRYAMGEQQ
jgi:hypothetical protein